MASSSDNRGLSGERNQNSGDDVISSLPDEVLVHILSYLLTKDTFRTSILSTRWKTLWTAVPYLQFCPAKDFSDLYGGMDPRYVDFIEMIFRSHNSIIKKFRVALSCTAKVDSSRFKAWIKCAVQRNVEDVDVKYFNTDVQVPKSLFTCKTLVTLKLRYVLKLDVPASIHFPCLKVLEVSLCSPSNDLTQKLFCSSLVLEELRIHILKDFGNTTYNISSPSLKSLYLSISADGPRFHKSDTIVNIDAPVLEFFEVIDGIFDHYILKNMSTLVKTRVIMDVCRFYDRATGNSFLAGNINMLLKSVSAVKDLSLCGVLPVAVLGSACEIERLVFDDVTSLELQNLDDFDSPFLGWPAFPNLDHLHLSAKKNDFASKNLSDLLEFAPNIGSLVLGKGNFCMETEKFNCSELRVPSCFRYSLKEIDVHGFDGQGSRLNLIKYLLMNVQLLEKMTLKFSPEISCFKQRKEELKSMIDMMPRCSKYSKLVFI